MPHFSSWSWPLRYIGPFDAALDKIARVERGTPWEKKVDKAVWRGTAWFDPEWNPGLRPKLIEAAGEKEWADVEIWSEEKNNTLAIEECCKYKYIIYAEVSNLFGFLELARYYLFCRGKLTLDVYPFTKPVNPS